MEYIAILFPLLSALIAGLLGPYMGRQGTNVMTCSLMVIATIASFFVAKDIIHDGLIRVMPLFTWIDVAGLNISWSLRFDTLSMVMILVVNLISTAVHIYSIGYMSHDNGPERFMSYLGLFTFMMLMLVTADNLVQLFFGWEGVGLASYLLIGFWVQKVSANNAAMKAFVVNRIGDFGLALGIFATYAVFGSLNFDVIFEAVHGSETIRDAMIPFAGYQLHAISLICGLLFLGAMGKSAQLGLHVWLPDAMEGPTPVSALIHAATMVTAGVFLVARLSPLYEFAPDVRAFMTILGGLTALIAATIAITQYDIKRVIAYSTMSQLGYMFFALGVSAYSAAMFHLFTHAFFKALLFLGAGSVIHAMSDEQDMRRMGGLWKAIPSTYMMMWIGSLALAGVPFLSGYFSKDLIIEAAYASHQTGSLFAFWCGCAAAFLTAFYSWRLLFMTFHGQPRCDEKVQAHIHESPAVMLMPLSFLAAGALMLGWRMYPIFVGEDRERFWGESLFVLMKNDSVYKAHHVEKWVKLLPVILAVSGIVLAWLFYVRATTIPGKLAARFKRTHALLSNKWYFDEIYERLIIIPLKSLGRFFWKSGDVNTIDGFGPDGVADAVYDAAQGAKKLQSGLVYNYAFAMLVGLVLLASIYFMGLLQPFYVDHTHTLQAYYDHLIRFLP